MPHESWYCSLVVSRKDIFYHLEVMPVTSFGFENLLCGLLDMQGNPDVDSYFFHVPSVK